MPKKRNRMYFTLDTQDAIVKYNKSDSYTESNKLYQNHIHKAFDKLAENIINTFKFQYFDVPYQDVKHEVVAFLIEKMPKYTEGKGKAFSYFSIVAKNYLILHNNNNYKKLKQKAPVTVLDTHRDVTSEEWRRNAREERRDFMELFIEYCTNHHDKLVTKQRDKKILFALLEIFRTRDNIENFNKKALYIMIREMTDVKTGYITRVVNIIKSRYLELYKSYTNRGTISK